MSGTEAFFLAVGVVFFLLWLNEHCKRHDENVARRNEQLKENAAKWRRERGIDW